MPYIWIKNQASKLLHKICFILLPSCIHLFNNLDGQIPKNSQNLKQNLTSEDDIQGTTNFTLWPVDCPLVFPNPALSCTFIHTCVEAQTAYPDCVYSSPLTSPQAWEFAHHWPSLPPEDRPGEEDHRGAQSGLQGPRYQGHDLEGLVQALVGHIRKTCSDEARGDLRCVALLSGWSRNDCPRNFLMSPTAPGEAGGKIKVYNSPKQHYTCYWFKRFLLRGHLKKSLRREETNLS